MNNHTFPQSLRLAADGHHTALFDALADRLKADIGFAFLTVLIPENSGKYLYRIYSTDESGHPIERADLVRDDPWFDRLFGTGEPVIAADPSEISHWLPDYDGLTGTEHGALLNYPVVAGGQTIGIINLVSSTGAYGRSTADLIAGSIPLAAMAIATYVRSRALQNGSG